MKLKRELNPGHRSQPVKELPNMVMDVIDGINSEKKKYLDEICQEDLFGGSKRTLTSPKPD